MNQELTGRELAQNGAQAAIDNAVRKFDYWQQMAHGFLLEFIDKLQPGALFMAEDVRAYAYAKGLPKPPSERAWGAIMQKASGRKLICKMGYQSVMNPRAHGANARLWARGVDCLEAA